MLKKSITYEDYNGVERTEDFYFNLTKAEIMDMELSTTGGFTEMIQKIISTQDVPAVTKVFKDIVDKAYGEKSLDGRRFVKKGADGRLLVEEFKETEAYSQLFMELTTDAEAASNFINGILPKVSSTVSSTVSANA